MLPVDCAVRRDCICRQGTCVVKDKTTTTTTTTTTKPTTTTTTPTTTTKTTTTKSTTTTEAGECTNAKVVLILKICFISICSLVSR